MMEHKSPIVDDYQGREVVELIHPTSPSSEACVFTAEELGIEIDQEQGQEEKESASAMPPAPFQQMAPGSPGSIGEEEGMEALWVEELVTPSPTAELSTVVDSKPESAPSQRRSSAFFQKRMGPRWKRQPKEDETTPMAASTQTPSRKKVQRSVKVLDEKADEPQLNLPPSTGKKSRKAQATAAIPMMEQRQSSFGEAEGNDERDAEASQSSSAVLSDTLSHCNMSHHRKAHASSPSGATLQSDTSKAISVKTAKARELLASALHGNVDASEREGIAQAAFAEATSARLMMEGVAAPKGLDLVLRAASHKGRSAALAAAFSPENTEQQSRANHYMDLILPVKAFPITTPTPVPRAVPSPGQGANAKSAQHEDGGDVSTLGFDQSLTKGSLRHTTATGGSASRSPLSMSSLNEILDGPEDQNVAKKASIEEKSGKNRLSFLKKRKDDPPEVLPAQPRDLLPDTEMPPPEDAPDMDDNASWTDVSLDEGGIEASQAQGSPEKPRKTKRVFRLAKLAGLSGGAAAAKASNDGSTKSGKRGWMRKNRRKSAMPNGPMVDQVPTPPPNVPYQSKPYQVYQTTVKIETGSRVSNETKLSKEVSTVVLRTRDVDVITQEKLTAALLADQTEHVTSYDGVKMFGQNEEDEEEEGARKDPPEEIDDSLPKRSMKVDPQFIPAPEGIPAILTAQSWDSLLASDAVRKEERPFGVARMMRDCDDADEEDMQGPGDHYTQQMRSTPKYGDDPSSPASYHSNSPGLVDKYSSTEERALDDRYSMEENENGLAGIKGASSFDSKGVDERQIKNNGSMFDVEEEDEEAQAESEIPDTPRRRRSGLGLVARMRSRRRSKESQVHEVSGDVEEDLLDQEPQTPTTKKSRRKLKLFKTFQAKKRHSKDRYSRGVPIEEVEYDELAKQVQTDLTMQQTETFTDGEYHDGHQAEQIEIEEEEEEIVDTTMLKATDSEDTTDSLIRRLRKQSGRSRRGMDPTSSNTADMARGLDP